MSADPGLGAADEDRLPPLDPMRLDDAVARIVDSIASDRRTHRLGSTFLPDRDEVIAVLDRLGWLLFPGYFGPRNVTPGRLRAHVAAVTAEIGERLFRQLDAAFRYERGVAPGSRQFELRCAECEARASEVGATFLARIPEIRRLLSLDVQAAFDGDPAARHTDEIIFCYPGIRALAVHRCAHALMRLGVPLIPRMMAEHAHSQTGIDIHPGASIGKSFFIDHGTGVVIGETAVIGDHCRVYQGVTLGAAFFEKDDAGRMVRDTKRHPTLEDHVTVYAGATILGGTTVIGAGSQINGGVFVTSSVPPGHVVRAPRLETTLRSNPETPPAMYAI
ncbi:MAG TPA: serine O-acetyltransferase [Phycisphaerales bacterium]|nr:serine O-acetyltransferase [Phycisphaerales bacterium]HMP37182.1 serine O-acetyltransferase [Phycisphaerales bacterium]